MAKPKRKKSDPAHQICEAALRLAARRGWPRLTLEEIARAAKVPLPQAKKTFRNKDDILPEIVRMMDNLMVGQCGKPDLKASPRDRLFEIIMVRLDELQARRRGILALRDALKNNPGLIRPLLLAERETAKTILALAGLEPTGLHKPLIIWGLLGIYGLTLCAWQKDSSEDMAKTMAALDRYLRHASSITGVVLRRYP